VGYLGGIFHQAVQGEMFIFNDYFFSCFFEKQFVPLSPSFMQTKVDKQDTLDKPQIVPHKTETTTYLIVFQTDKNQPKALSGE
jgi:hypothetical protein